MSRFSPIKSATPPVETPSEDDVEISPPPTSAHESVPMVAVRKDQETIVSLSYNTAKNGLQLHFISKPDEEIRGELKAAGWRWSFRNNCWYHRDTPANQDFAERFVARCLRTATMPTETQNAESEIRLPSTSHQATPQIPTWRMRLAAR
jgi:hypothetical protein